MSLAVEALNRCRRQLLEVSKGALATQRAVAQARAAAVKQPYVEQALNERHINGVAAAAESLKPGQVDEISAFLKNQWEYKQLLIRYQGEEVDSPERVRLSARRVGLDMPEEH